MRQERKSVRKKAELRIKSVGKKTGFLMERLYCLISVAKIKRVCRMLGTMSVQLAAKLVVRVRREHGFKQASIDASRIIKQRLIVAFLSPAA